MNHVRTFWAVFLGTLALDQFTKWWVRVNLAETESLGLPWPRVFEIKLVYNEGIAFGMFQGYGVLLAPIAIAIAVVAARFSYRHPQESRWVHAAMGLLASGAIGNLYDRIALGKVTDMFWLRLGNVTGGRMSDFPVFNVADICITCAAVLLIVKWAFEAKPKPPAPAPKETPAP